MIFERKLDTIVVRILLFYEKSSRITPSRKEDDQFKMRSVFKRKEAYLSRWERHRFGEMKELIASDLHWLFRARQTQFCIFFNVKQKKKLTSKLFSGLFLLSRFSSLQFCRPVESAGVVTIFSPLSKLNLFALNTPI